MQESLFVSRDISSLIIFQALSNFIRGFITNIIKELIIPSVNDIFGDPKFILFNKKYDISETINYFILLILGIYVIKLYNKPLKPSHFIIRYMTNIKKSNVKDLDANELIKVRMLSSSYGLFSVLLCFIIIIFGFNLITRY